MKIRSLLCIGLILLAAAAFGATAASAEWVRVKWVADGDTIVLQDGRHVRYIGIDTPEKDHQGRKGEPLADWARSINRHLVEDQRLRLVFDRQKKDRYHRTLAYVYRSDGVLVNAELVKRGCAHVLVKWPNVSKTDHLLKIQRAAMQTGMGIWRQVKKDERPRQPYRGNRKSMRFHRHDCAMGRTMAVKNQVWLKSQWEAFWAGYAPARGCIDFP